MKDFRLGHFCPIVSDILEAEIQKAPQFIIEVYKELLALDAVIVNSNDEVLRLVDAYQKKKILTPKFKNDAIHIALATVYKADILVSWNFKHIVHFDKIRQFNAINENLGYSAISIYSPREVTNYEEKI